MEDVFRAQRADSAARLAQHMSSEEKREMADRFDAEQQLVDKIAGSPNRKARRDMERFVKTRERKQRRRSR